MSAGDPYRHPVQDFTALTDSGKDDNYQMTLHTCALYVLMEESSSCSLLFFFSLFSYKKSIHLVHSTSCVILLTTFNQEFTVYSFTICCVKRSIIYVNDSKSNSSMKHVFFAIFCPDS